MNPSFDVRAMRPEDIRGAVALQRSCFPPPFPSELLWNALHLERHLEVFPIGQFIALADGAVIGSASALLISEESWLAHSDWESTTGGPLLDAHNANGSTLYAVDISVHPGFRGRGVARSLYRARFELVRELGLTRFGTACRIPDFRAWRSQIGLTPEDYLQAVVQGMAVDRTLSPLLKMGLTPMGIVENYMEDAESAHAAALLEWKP